MDKSTNKEDKQKKKKNKEEKQFAIIYEKSNQKLIEYQDEIIRKQMMNIYNINEKIEKNNKITQIINELYINYFELFNDSNHHLKNIQSHIKKQNNNDDDLSDVEEDDENNINNVLNKKIAKIIKKTKKILKIIDNNIDYTKNE